MDDNKYTNLLQKKIKAKDKPGDVLRKEVKLIDKEIKHLEKSMKDIDKIDFDNLSKMNKKSLIFILNRDNVLDNISIPTVGSSIKNKTLEILTKFAKINVKLNLFSKLSEELEKFEDLNTWYNDSNKPMFVIVENNSTFYKYELVDDINHTIDIDKYQLQVESGDYTRSADRTDRNLMDKKYKRYEKLGKVLLSMLASIKNFNKKNNKKNLDESNKIAGNNLFKVLKIGDITSPIDVLELKPFTLTRTGEVELYAINKNNFDHFLDDLKNNSDKMKNNSDSLKEFNEGENIIKIFKNNIEEILVKDVEYGIFNTKKESLFIKSKKEYISYINRLLITLKKRQQMLKSIDELPKLFRTRIDLDRKTYEQDLDLYLEEIEVFKDDKRTRIVVINKNSTLIMNNLKEDFNKVIESIKIYNDAKKRVRNVGKILRKKRKTVTEKELVEVQNVVAQIEYIMYDITYYILLMKQKLVLLKNKKYKIFNIKISKIASRLDRIIPPDIRKIIKKYAKNDKSFAKFIITNISHSTLSNMVNNGNTGSKKNNGRSDDSIIDGLTLVAAFNNLNNINKNAKKLNNNNGNNSVMGFAKNSHLISNDRKIFIPYVRTVGGGLLKEHGLLDLSDLFFDNEVRMISKVTLSTVKKELYDKSYLVLNARTAKLNDPSRWKLLNYDKVKDAFGSKNKTLIRRTIYRLLNNVRFYSQKTLTWESDVDNIKSVLMKFCKATSNRYGRCDYVMSLEDLDFDFDL